MKEFRKQHFLNCETNIADTFASDGKQILDTLSTEQNNENDYQAWRSPIEVDKKAEKRKNRS